ncbi:hypothetical protein Avbf_16400 [Armadillidium vulgare]|nr:hypothetical protein Avbf_16400 [Armadillidium vulgare]
MNINEAKSVSTASNNALNPTSNEALSPSSNDALNPSSNDALNPSSNDALNPSSNDALNPSAQAPDYIYLNPTFKDENSVANEETSKEKPTTVHNDQNPKNDIGQNPDNPPPYEFVVTNTQQQNLAHNLPIGIRASSYPYPQPIQGYDLAYVSRQTGQPVGYFISNISPKCYFSASAATATSPMHGDPSFKIEK